MSSVDADAIRDFHGRPLDVVASLLRSCFVPAKGHIMVVGDFSQIEARIIAWLAGQKDALDVFRSGQDIYVYTAAKIGSDNRQLGKVLVLACGFGMGPGKFQETALTYGIKLTATEAEELVKAWRKANSRIMDFWYQLGGAALQVLAGRVDTLTVGPVQIGMGRRKLAGCMLIRLPSGRHLVYRHARIKDDQITYDGVNQTTKNWGEIRTYGGKLAENVTQAVAADVLRVALRRLDDQNFKLITTIHDEIVTEVPASWGKPGVTAMQICMTNPIPWAPDLPLAADVRTMERYGK